ncbi:PTS transporter subunit EIIC [Spiroplasma monobiae]|uniref:PTS system trehalose-specific IIBC component n=1 Tax=Spiroplasma monobiae MQ-1 TaxID=1336748 RepID=A0A2K9LWE5_SPISQ|nr:PTS transporter subunit EIIC [Spiroplasma monobiae]AUM62715.1 PTS system trehalose-specific IIBC component [Spiroplasma monobiae MQ-1]
MEFKKEDIENLTNLVGGVENIEKIYNCMTRLRFIVKNKELFKSDEIKKISFVQGVVLSSGEYQVIIGPSVAKLFKVFVIQNNIEIAKDLKDKEVIADLSTKKQRRSFLTFVSQIFSPLLIVLVTIGFWEMLRMPVFLASNSIKEAEWLQQWDDFNKTISRGLTYFVVIGVSWSTFKCMNANPIYGIVVGAALCNPFLTSLSDIQLEPGQTIINAMPGWKIFGDFYFPWKISFEGMVIPMVLVAYIGSLIQQGLQKAKFGNFRMLIEPTIVIVSTILIGIIFIAPIGLLFTSYLSIAFNYLMTHQITKYIFTPIIGALYSPMVIFGIHRTITPILMQDIVKNDGSLILGLLIFSNVSTAVATFAFGLKNKNCKKVRQVAYSNAVSGFVAGVTEPCIYSVGVKYVYPMVGAVIGTYFGCLLYTASGVWTTAAPFGILGIIGFVQKAPEGININTWAGGNFLWGFLSMILTISISFTSTLLLSKIKFFENRTKKILKNEYDFDWKEVGEKVLKLKLELKENINQLIDKTNRKTIKNSKKQNYVKISELNSETKNKIKILKGA